MAHENQGGDTLTLREALNGMGYRETRKGVWGKPFGFMLFTFEEELSEMTAWFKCLDGSGLGRYCAEKLKPDYEKAGSPLYQLKYFECFAATDKGPSSGSRFEFGAIDL